MNEIPKLKKKKIHHSSDSFPAGGIGIFLFFKEIFGPLRQLIEIEIRGGKNNGAVIRPAAEAAATTHIPIRGRHGETNLLHSLRQQLPMTWNSISVFSHFLYLSLRVNSEGNKFPKRFFSTAVACHSSSSSSSALGSIFTNRHATRMREPPPVKGEDVPGLYLNLHLVETFLRVNEALPNRNLLLPLLLQYVGLQGSRVIQANKSQGKTEKKRSNSLGDVHFVCRKSRLHGRPHLSFVHVPQTNCKYWCWGEILSRPVSISEEENNNVARKWVDRFPSAYSNNDFGMTSPAGSEEKETITVNIINRREAPQVTLQTGRRFFLKWRNFSWWGKKKGNGMQKVFSYSFWPDAGRARARCSR